jgi:CHAT domain-containing protein
MPKYFIICFLSSLTICGQCPEPISIENLLHKEGMINTTTWIELSKNIAYRLKFCSNNQDSLTGVFYHVLGRSYEGIDINLAIYYTQKAIEVRKKLKPNQLLANSFYNLGLFRETNNDYQDALQEYKSSFIAAESDNHKARCLPRIAAMYLKIGAFQEGIAFAKQGVLLSKKCQSDDLCAKNLIELSNNYIGIGHFREALLAATEAEKLIGNLTDTQDIFSILIIKGVALGTLGSYKRARLTYHQSAQFAPTTLQKLIKSDHNIAYCLYEEGDIERAEKLFLTIESQIDKDYSNDVSDYISNIYVNIGDVYYIKNNFDKADIYYQKAFAKIIRQFNPKTQKLPTLSQLRFCANKSYLLNIFLRKSFVMSRTKLLSKTIADQTYHLADQLIDLMRQEHTEQSSKLFWREKTHGFYENALETCYRLGDTKNAFYFMEKSRAILLLDALKDLNAKEILTPKQQAEEQKLRYITTGLQNKLESLPEHEKNYAATFQQLFEAKEKYQKFIKSLEQSNPAYYRLKYDNQYVSLDNWQKYLSKNQQSAIQYFVGDNAVYTLAITPQKTTFKKINLTDYKQLALKYNRLAAQSPPHTKAYFDDLKQTAHQLYQLIFAPFDLPKGRVVVSPDGYFIPFNALVSNPKTNQYLLQKYAFSYAYSANILLQNQQSNWSLSHDLLAIAPVRFQKSLRVPSLVQSDVFASNIENQYFSGKLLTNATATKQNFIDNASKYNLIQLFTHGKADSTEVGSKIYFQDKVLTLKELYGMKDLKADLVVLSACQTNLGKIATGEGVMSLARGFAYLGVPSTVSTLWSVNDKSTYQITTSFYKYLNDGLAKDIALQKAQQDYLSQEGNMMPYFWSSMVLVGNVEELPKHHYLYLFLIIFAGLSVFFITTSNKRNTISG